MEYVFWVGISVGIKCAGKPFCSATRKADFTHDTPRKWAFFGRARGTRTLTPGWPEADFKFSEWPLYARACHSNTPKIPAFKTIMRARECVQWCVVASEVASRYVVACVRPSGDT